MTGVGPQGGAYQPTSGSVQSPCATSPCSGGLGGEELGHVCVSASNHHKYLAAVSGKLRWFDVGVVALEMGVVAVTMVGRLRRFGFSLPRFSFSIVASASGGSTGHKNKRDRELTLA